MNRGQSTLEYVVIIAVVVAGLLAMQIYMKRGVQGKLRDAGDQIGEQFVPNNTTWTYNTISNSRRKEESLTTGESSSTLLGDETQKKSGDETIVLGNETKLF